MKSSLRSKALYFTILLDILLISLVFSTATAAVDDFYVSYTVKEKEILKKFKTEVKDLISHDWQNEDSYLIWWLRARELDISQAKDMFAKSQKFKKDNKIDGIQNEKELINLQKQYPIAYGEAFDKKGRPALQVAFASWDLRRVMLAGKRDLMNRYILYAFENISAKMREVKRSQFIFFIDMFMYNLRQHACLACVPFYIDLVNNYENYYAGTAKELPLINTPRIFEAVLQIVRPLMSAATRRDLKVFGVDKTEWQPYLLNIFDANQLTSQYGGTKSS